MEVLTTTREPGEVLPHASSIPFHPCLNDEAHGRVARIHLPVAPRCNLACAYCERILSDDPDLPGPGTAAAVMTPGAAALRALAFLHEYGGDSIVGIAGPGDPLANEETFECLERVRQQAPGAALCLCTNGLALPQSMDRLVEIGVDTLTVTVNGVTPDTVAQVQPRIREGGTWIKGTEAARLLIDRQREGIARAAGAGMVVKVNMVVIPQINMREAEAVSGMAAQLGAKVFNPMPLIPRNGLKHFCRPTGRDMAEVRRRCGKDLYVFTKCKQCRADAVGIPGKEHYGCQMTRNG
jgi:nitrogen fixation protein NifB